MKNRVPPRSENRTGERLLQYVPQRAFATDNLECGVQKHPRDKALCFRLIQLNAKSLTRYLAFDLDYPGAVFSWQDANLPQPSWTAENPSNGHAHVVYELADPVCMSANGRAPPIKFFEGVRSGYIRRLSADPCYTALLSKNPLHPGWRTTWGEERPYTLNELADWLFPGDAQVQRRRPVEVPESRNCTLFEALRLEAYPLTVNLKAMGYGEHVLRSKLEPIAFNLNRDFSTPLPISEVRSTVRSVAKWTWRHFSPEGLARTQAIRGEKGGKISGERRAKLARQRAAQAHSLLETILARKPYQIIEP